MIELHEYHIITDFFVCKIGHCLQLSSSSSSKNDFIYTNYEIDSNRSLFVINPEEDKPFYIHNIKRIESISNTLLKIVSEDNSEVTLTFTSK